MPNLRPDERMQRCEYEEHDEIRKQKYYIVRSYYNELENHFCQGCLELMRGFGHLRYTQENGYVPVTTDIEKLLNIYGVKGYYEKTK